MTLKGQMLVQNIICHFDQREKSLQLTSCKTSLFVRGDRQKTYTRGSAIKTISDYNHLAGL